LSAVGRLTAPRRRDLERSWADPAERSALPEALAALADEAAALVAGPSGAGAAVASDVAVETAVDCRYQGQSHELTVPTVADFAAEHGRRNGYAPEGRPVEVIALRATATRAPVVELDALPPVPPRIDGVLAGPAVLAEPDCTVWVPEGWVAEPGAAGALVLRRAGGAARPGAGGAGAGGAVR
jgi:N-methylhydantoinase A/oxoprolinase/acetone carboxylase beta subunit